MDSNFLKVAKEAAKEAGLLIRQNVDKKIELQYKNNDVSNIVTATDLLSEKIIIQKIKENFPTHNLISEEAGRKDYGSEYTWVIDPLDGTVSFAHNMPHFSVSIGLLKNQTPVLGVIYNVMTDKLYWAEQERGAYMNGKPIKISQIKALNEAAVLFGFGSIKRRKSRIDGYFASLIGKAGHPYSLGSAATSYTFVASGSAEATIDEGWIWDFAAGVVIVREAGGKVTDFAGNEIDWSKERLSLIATNGLVHEEILEALKK